MVARYQGAQNSHWRHLRHACQATTPVRHDNSATEYHNGYAVDSTVYAATYNGRLTDGNGEDPLGQRVYRTVKHIWQEILHHCSTISAYLSIEYLLVGPTCRGPTPVYAPSLHYKRGTPARE